MLKTPEVDTESRNNLQTNLGICLFKIAAK